MVRFQPMKLSLKPHHLKRYKDIAMLFWKYGTSDLAKEFANDSGTDEKKLLPAKPGQPAPEELADDLEKMGPTFIKFGQLLSSRPDLLPEPYLKALARLQDKVKPFPYAQVEEIVSSELGVRISKAFSYFDEKHLAAASLGQVHRAALRDGRPVVVKVQRPDIRKQIAEDFEVLEEIAGFFDEHTDIGRRYRFGKILAEFKSSILQELDYQREASNLTTLANNLKEFPHILRAAARARLQFAQRVDHGLCQRHKNHRAKSRREAGHQWRCSGRGTFQGVSETGFD